LEEQSKDKPLKPIFSFIINKEGNELQVFGVDTVDAKLISSEGYDNDVKLSDLKARIEFDKSGINPMPTYYINLHKGKKEESENKGLTTWGDFTNSDRHFRVEIDKEVMQTTTQSESFIVVICYKDEKQKKEFAYAFKIHLCTKENLIEAAMDFGSEASQIYVNNDKCNLNLISSFEKFHSFSSWKWETDKTTGKVQKKYWQGEPDDDLYKSIFFINSNPDITEIVDEPNKNSDKTFIQTLIPENYEPEKYNCLTILPNLKLVELLQGSTWKGEIKFPYKNPFDDTSNTLRLSSPIAKNGILRMVLNNFLHCLLKDKSNTDATKKRYLRLLLLMPNVYYQQKVYSIIKNLYEDFEKIRTFPNTCQQYLGIEIQMLSESDAAFMGAKIDSGNSDNMIQKCVDNGFFLIVDAGKGTTDFSILRQQGLKRSVFDSLYRNGIPASGHFITYAFYEAIKDFLNSNGISLKELVEKAERATLLGFMAALEQFKINYNNYKCIDVKVITDKTSLNNLGGVTNFLLQLLNAKEHIPNVQDKVTNKIGQLVKEIEDAIQKGIKQTPDFEQFEQVLLTGRGLQFEPFRQQLQEMLIKNRWIKSKDDIHSFKDSKKAKTICLEGAFETQKIEINNNSELIGRPYTDVPNLKTKNPLSKIKNWAQQAKQKYNNKGAFLDKDFFYNGITGIQSDNLNIFISGRRIESDVNDTTGNERRIYFVGEHFIIQSNKKSKIITEQMGKNLDDVVKQTLFPFYSEFPDSFNKENLTTSTPQPTVQPKQDEQKEEIIINEDVNA
jgi:hypothetical protein